MSLFSRNKIMVRMPIIRDKRGRLDVRGLDEFKRGITRVGPKLKSELRKTAIGYVDQVKPYAESLAKERQQPIAVKSIQPQLFKGLPSLRAGGSKKYAMSDGRGGKHKVPAGVIFAGAEFGSNQQKHSGHMTRHKAFYMRSFVAGHKNGSTAQFPKRSARFGRGAAGWFFYPAIREKVNPKIVLPAYFRNMNDIMRKYT